MIARSSEPRVEAVEVWAFTVPTDGPESDGTLEWQDTTALVVEVDAGAARGVGYSFTHASAASLVKEELAPLLLGHDPTRVGLAHDRAMARCRNLGRPGLASMAVSACDAALWDLKARLLGRSLVDLLGAVRDMVPVYASGGFCSYSVRRLQRQLAGWAEEGIARVKLKVGRQPEQDVPRVTAAREAVGPGVALMVDANGAYGRKQALDLARAFRERGVVWFEEPVSSDDLEGLALVRHAAPAGLEVTAGEYGWDAWYFRRMLQAGAVDVLQPDATRCGGPTGFMKAATLAEAFGAAASAHTAPTLHGHLAASSSAVRDVEYFHDHVLVEGLLFDGALRARDGALRPDRARPGLGLELRVADAARFCVAHERCEGEGVGGRRRPLLKERLHGRTR